MDVTTPQFWVALLQIIAIDILLGGDNAVVIALACRRLPPRLRNQGIFWGVFGAIALRVVLIFFAITLLKVPCLKIVGALLLVWIGVKLLLPEDDGAHEIAASDYLLGAIKTIIVADAVMSLDNVVAIAGAAKDSMLLIVLGLLISVPIIVWGSKLVLTLMERYPLIITAGGALLGWIGGSMFVSDVVVKDWVAGYVPWLVHAAPVAGALLVIAIGKLVAGRRVRRAAAPVDLATEEQAAPPAHQRSR